MNRIVAPKDLGFSLEQVRSILDDKVSAEELRGMLRLRQTEIQSQLAADTARLARPSYSGRKAVHQGHRR